MAKNLIKIDILSDTVCPWCFIGKKYLEKAMDSCKDKFDFEVRWHPYMLNPNVPKEGVNKLEHYKQKFGSMRVQSMVDRVGQVFAGLGVQYSMGGKTGNTLDSHRLIALAGRQGLENQNNLVEELFLNYFAQEKHLGDRQVLLNAAQKAGIEGADQLLDDPNAGVKEIHEEIKKYARGVNGVPHFTIGDRIQLSGAQPPQSFVEAFELAAKPQ
ncbi:hypothetical protein Mapa_016434 [Marchantia paleacea]|nr:hypothetical protein Mapa_016434 [Marchantia paleacea]